MKKLVFILAATVSISFASAQKIQKKNVPASVRSALHKKFPEAGKVLWEIEDSNYEAGFKLKGTTFSVLLNPSGNVIETETAISIAELAAPIKEYVNRNFPGQKIKEAAKITDAVGIVTYEAEVKGKDLIFDHNGKFIEARKD